MGKIFDEVMGDAGAFIGIRRITFKRKHPSTYELMVVCSNFLGRDLFLESEMHMLRRNPDDAIH